MRKVNVGEIYKHFKGHVYMVIAIAYDTEKYGKENPDESKVVVYQNLDTKEVWVRPYEMFISRVDHQKYPNVKQEYRFEKYKIESE